MSQLTLFEPAPLHIDAVCDRCGQTVGSYPIKGDDWNEPTLWAWLAIKRHKDMFHQPCSAAFRPQVVWPDETEPREET